MRSTTLDTKVWEPPVVALFQQLGNEFGREVWEGGLAAAAAGGSAGGTQVGVGAGRGGSLKEGVLAGFLLVNSWGACCSTL